jgi:hypothetical protein
MEILAKLAVDGHIPGNCSGCPSLKQGSTSIIQREVVKPTTDLGERENRFGPHYQKLFYFGQRLRDCFLVHSSSEFLESYVEANLPLWGILEKEKVTPRNAEERGIEKEWRNYLYDARTHPLFLSFKQHLDGNNCWAILEQIKQGYSDFYETSMRLYSAIKEGLKPLARRMTVDGLETMNYRLLRYAESTGNVPIMRFEEDIKDDYTVAPDGNISFPLLHEEFKTKQESIKDLELGQAEIRMSEIIQTWVISSGPSICRENLEKIIKEFQRAIGSDDHLLELVVSGHCESCHKS